MAAQTVFEARELPYAMGSFPLIGIFTDDTWAFKPTWSGFSLWVDPPLIFSPEVFNYWGILAHRFTSSFNTPGVAPDGLSFQYQPPVSNI